MALLNIWGIIRTITLYPTCTECSLYRTVNENIDRSHNYTSPQTCCLDSSISESDVNTHFNTKAKMAMRNVCKLYSTYISTINI